MSFQTLQFLNALSHLVQGNANFFCGFFQIPLKMHFHIWCKQASNLHEEILVSLFYLKTQWFLTSMSSLMFFEMTKECKKIVSHVEQLNGFLPVQASLCLFKSPSSEDFLSQVEHLNDYHQHEFSDVL